MPATPLGSSDGQETTMNASDTQNLVRFFELRAAYKAASSKAYARRDEIAKERRVGLSGAMRDPEFISLNSESCRLFEETEALTGAVIRANLKNLGIEDFEAERVIFNEDGKELERQKMFVSELCCLRDRPSKKPGWLFTGINRTIVEKDGVYIGSIDSDGRFQFETAPNLRIALGWLIATDGGRDHVIENFRLDETARLVVDVVRRGGVSMETFFDVFSKALSFVFVYEHTSRFGAGYTGAMTTLWQVATREIGEPHEGFPFLY